MHAHVVTACREFDGNMGKGKKGKGGLGGEGRGGGKRGGGGLREKREEETRKFDSIPYLIIPRLPKPLHVLFPHLSSSCNLTQILNPHVPPMLNFLLYLNPHHPFATPHHPFVIPPPPVSHTLLPKNLLIFLSFPLQLHSFPSLFD